MIAHCGSEPPATDKQEWKWQFRPLAASSGRQLGQDSRGGKAALTPVAYQNFGDSLLSKHAKGGTRPTAAIADCEDRPFAPAKSGHSR